MYKVKPKTAKQVYYKSRDLEPFNSNFSSNPSKRFTFGKDCELLEPPRTSQFTAANRQQLYILFDDANDTISEFLLLY